MKVIDEEASVIIIIKYIVNMIYNTYSLHKFHYGLLFVLLSQRWNCSWKVDFELPTILLAFL